MKTEIAADDYDLIDYINQLREGICEAYTGIIQGLRADKKGLSILFRYLNCSVDKVIQSCDAIVRFISHIAQDPNNRTEAVTRGAVGILGYGFFFLTVLTSQ
jgi:importin subunit beta-1